MRIFLIGFMGSGKTYWGKRLSEILQVPFADLDRMIEEEKGKSINEIFTIEGEEGFRIAERNQLEKWVDSQPVDGGFVLSTGGGTPCFFNTIDYLKQQGQVIWIDTPIDILLQRLYKERDERPLLKSLSNEELRSYILKKLGERKMYYEKADTIIRDEIITIEKFLEAIAYA